MKQKSLIINLIELVGDSFAFGNEMGRAVFGKLQNIVDNNPQQNVFGISLEGIDATDASFPRESVVSLAKLLRGDKGFYLIKVSSKDLLDNWSYAATAKDQPIFVYDSSYTIIGSVLTEGTKQLIDFIMKNEFTTTSMVASAFDLSTQNASGKLKKLYREGFILGKKEVAESGGHEFVYVPIK